MTVDATGTVVNGYTYDVYGKKTSSTGSQPNEFDFAGQQTDATGLQYLRARYYDPATGTFLSRDPMSASPGWTQSPYGYAGGNPVNGSDPTGLCSWRDPFCSQRFGEVTRSWGSAVGGAIIDATVAVVSAVGNNEIDRMEAEAAGSNAAAESAASAAAGCAANGQCRATAIFGAYLAGAILLLTPADPVGWALIGAASAASAATDANDCFNNGSRMGCGLLAVDAATAGAGGFEAFGIRAGASAGQAPWETMLQRPAAAVANWGVHIMASPAADAGQQIWSFAYSTGKWANDGFGDGW